MRTTISIDDDLLAAAKSLARSTEQPLGKVVSDLIRRGLQAAPRVKKTGPDNLPVFRVSPNARPIAPEDVKRDEDEW